MANGCTFGAHTSLAPKRPINTYRSQRHIYTISYKWLWNSSYKLSHKIFFWLPLKETSWMLGMLRRRTMLLDDYSFVFCPCLNDKILEHLCFFIAPFAQQCWCVIGIRIDTTMKPFFKFLNTSHDKSHNFSSWKVLSSYPGVYGPHETMLFSVMKLSPPPPKFASKNNFPWLAIGQKGNTFLEFTMAQVYWKYYFFCKLF